MNAKQKDFIRKKLIPFILREQGTGFSMANWRLIGDAGEVISSDHIERKIPPCGTVCCIGGSIEFLKGVNRYESNELDLGKLIGLTPSQTDGLFYGWVKGSMTETHWPAKFRQDFAARKSTLGKAKVAVALLKEVIRTEGKCLK